jgi:phage virion morphogenesis protein
MLTTSIDKGQTNKVLRELDFLTLTPKKRRRILRGAGRMVRRNSRRRIKDQSDLSGKKWQGRSNGRKKKMLSKMGKRLIVKTTPDKADIAFSDNRTAKIARAHHDGDTYEGSADTLAKKYGKLNGKAPATRRQAKALITAGYKIRQKPGKGWKIPTIKWIKENLSVNRAGFIIRLFNEQGGEHGSNNASVQRWNYRVRARSFLGQEQDEYKQLKNYMLDEATRLA